MAVAPKPGSTRRPTRDALRITLAGESRELVVGNLGPDDDLACRKATGMPLSSFIHSERFGADSLLVLWWMARRRSGEPRLRYDQVTADFPTFAALTAADPQVVELSADDAEDLADTSPE